MKARIIYFYKLIKTRWDEYFIAPIYMIKHWWRHQMVFRAERNAFKKKVYAVLDKNNTPFLKKWWLWKKVERELKNKMK